MKEHVSRVITRCDCCKAIVSEDIDEDDSPDAGAVRLIVSVPDFSDDVVPMPALPPGVFDFCNQNHLFQWIVIRKPIFKGFGQSDI